MIGQDHPRGCGEHENSGTDNLSEHGSSPRMRGAHLIDSYFIHTSRIIPADAGSTSQGDPTTLDVKDHPRGCGEHNMVSLSASMEYGSSPRMRGAHSGRFDGVKSIRIIPADAGSTPWCPATRRPSRDHPRGCGEHKLTHCIIESISGSSPRMRGAR